MIELEILNVTNGHTTIYIEETDREKRAELAATVLKLLKDGNVLFLVQGEEARRILGYDPDANEWIVRADPQPVPEQTRPQGRPRKITLSATGSSVVSVAPTAGG